MTAPVPAELHVLDRQGKSTKTIKVQFNPHTLRLQMTNSVDGATTRGRQTQQYNGSASTQLSLDLEFDTADEGTSSNPVDVRTKTDEVRQFMLPRGEQSKQAPPRVKFRWGTFELVGAMTSLSEELTLFSREGAALRSKLSVQIRAQDPKFEALESGPGANPARNVPAAGGGDRALSGPGSSGGGPIDRAAAALDGETAADFLARNGLAPEAWRALGDALGDGLELTAGVSIGFSASVSLGASVSVAAGMHAGLGEPLEASLGLGADGPAAGDGIDRQGFALAAAGGPTAAFETAKSLAAAAGADAARRNFGRQVDAPSSVASQVLAPGAARQPLAARPPAAATTAPAPPRADTRATTFGRDVPLRDRVGATGDDRYVVLGRPAPADPTAPIRGRSPSPWERLTPNARTRDAAPHRADGSGCGCGCGGGGAVR